MPQNIDTEAAALAESGVEELKPVYDKLNDKTILLILAAILAGLSKKEISKTLSYIDNEIATASVATKEFLDGALPEAYLLGIKEVNDKVKNYNPLSGLHSTQIEVMLNDAYLDFGTGLQGLKKNAGQILNKALGDQIRNTIAEGVSAGTKLISLNPKDFATSLAGQTMAKLKEQGFTAFIDRAGRQWSMQRYSEMLTRTHVIRGAAEGVTTRMKELGLSIVQMSTHGNVKDEACLEAQGKLYDLTGKRYPKPPSMPIHPNCTHTLGARPDLEI